MRRTLLVVLFAALAAAPLVPAVGAAPSRECKPGVAFQNDDVRVWFHGHKDLFKVFDTNSSEDSGSGWQYATSALEERDANGALVATMNLQRAFPQTSSCVVEESADFVNMTLRVTDGLEGHAGTASVDFTFHFNKTSHGVKFDLDVVEWPWSDGANHTLDFAFQVDASGNGTVEPASNGVGIRDGNGVARGYLEWAPNATARYADGHEETATVNATTDASGNHADVTLAFTNVTAGYTRLAYDPWMGAGDYVVVAGVLVGLAPVEQVLPRGALAAVRALL